jgi:tetratricopeptide (TPR) repeat protein
MKSQTVGTTAITLCILWFSQPVFATPLDDAAALMNQGKLEQSLALVNSTLPDPGNDFNRYALRGALLARLQQFEQAANWYRKMISIWPNQPAPKVNLGVIYERQQRFDAALEVFTEVTRKYPDHHFALVKMADLHIKLAARAYNQLLEAGVEDGAVRRKHYLSTNFDNVAAQLAPVDSKATPANN